MAKCTLRANVNGITINNEYTMITIVALFRLLLVSQIYSNEI